jgi:hypothetical protein
VPHGENAINRGFSNRAEPMRRKNQGVARSRFAVQKRTYSLERYAGFVRDERSAGVQDVTALTSVVAVSLIVL